MEHKRRAKALSWLLSLALVLSLLPGMGLTALATETETNYNITPSDLDWPEGQYNALATNVTFPYQTDAKALLAAIGYNGDSISYITSVSISSGSNVSLGEITETSGTADYNVGINITGQGESVVEVVAYATWSETITCRIAVSVYPADVILPTISLEEDALSIAIGNKMPLTATITPDNATDKTVKWSVSGTNPDAIKLYSDENCTTEIGSDATSALTVYAKGISAGDATVTVTSNSYTTRTASCEMTVSDQYHLWIGGEEVTSTNSSGAGWSYDVGSNTIALSNYSYTGVGYKEGNTDDPCSAIYYTGSAPLIIQLSGTNTITRTGSSDSHFGDASYCGIKTNNCSSLTITGSSTDSLSVICEGNKSSAIYLIGYNTTLTVQNVSLTTATTADSGNPSISCRLVKIVQGASVTATGGYNGISAAVEISENSFVIAAGNNKAISGTVKNSISGFGWTDKEGTEGKADIAVSSEGQTLDSYKKVQFPAHTHDFTYSADGDTITATCGAEGCTLNDGQDNHTATLTIAAPTLTTYGGTGDAAATLTGLDAFNSATGKTIAATDIKYAGRDSTTYAESTSAPTDAGTYTAFLTVESVTASVDYEIAKASAGTPTVTMAGYTYGETVSAPGIGAYSGAGAVTYYYNTADSTTGGTEWKDIAATTLAAGTYYMYAVIAEAENYSGYTTATTSFTVAAPYRLYVGGTQVTSSNAADVFGDGKVSYNAESNTLTLNGYSNGGSYYIEEEAGVYEADYRIAAGVYYAGAEKLTVALEGNNTLTMPEFSTDKLDNAAFFSEGDVVFTGAGSLNATGGNASDSSEDSNVGSYGLCAIGENAAFTGSGAVTFTAGSGESSYGAYFGRETAVVVSGGTVTMTGGTSANGSYGMYCGRAKVTGGAVRVTGGAAGTNSLGIYCWKDISVSGGAVTAAGGSAADSSYGFFGESISVTGGEATFTGGTGVNYSEGAYCKKDVSVTRGSLTAVGGSAKYSYGLYSYDGYENKNGVITYGVAVSNGKLTTAGGSATEKSCGLCLLYSAISVTGGEVEVTGGEAGKTSYGMDGGTYSVYARGGKLTAQGGTVTGDNGVSCGIYIGVAPFYIEGSATVNATGGQANVSGGESCGIRCMGLSMEGGEVTATGGVADDSFGVYIKSSLYVKSGTLTATGGNAKHSRGIYSDSLGVEVTGGTVAAVGGSGSEESCGVYLAARQHSDETYKASTLTITGGEVSATGGSCGVFCDPATDGKAIVITGGTATAQGNVAISKPPILGADVSASASTELDGTPAEYSEEENNNYKFFTTVTAPGSKTPITSVSFTVEEPVVGAEPAEWVEITTEPEGALTTTAYRAVWVEVDKDYNYVPMTSSLFETGKRYAVLEPNEANAGAPLVALCASGYVLPTDEEPVYTINGEVTMLFGYFGPYTPIEGAEFSVSVSPAELRFSAYTGYSEEDPSLYREITASNTGNGKVRFITAGFTESSMYEQFGLIVGGMTATVYPKEGLAEGTYRATVRIEDWYDRFDTIEVPVTFTVYTQSTAPGTPAAETVTIPVSGDDETVNVTVRVSGDTATITGADVDKVLKAEDVGTVTIDVSKLKQNVTEVVIPGAMVDKIADAVADESNNADGLEIKLPTGTVTFDAEAVAAIAEQANGKDVTLHLDGIKVTELASAQQAAVSDLEVEVVLDAYLTANGQRISDFNGGSATVKVPYTLKDGQSAQGLVVWYVADDGTKTQVPATYDGKNIVFDVPHFSNYVVAYDEEKAAACPKDDSCPLAAFTDLDPAKWYHDGIEYCLKNGMMKGVGNSKFDPNGTTSRAMIVTILYRLEGSPAVTGENPFTDVEDGQWYTNAVIWAAENNIVGGYGNGKFGPNDPITREQLATILYRYAQSKGHGFTGAWMFLLDYPDASEISSWADEAMHWCMMNEIINGKDGKLVPGGDASRAEAATMLMRFVQAAE